MSGGTMTPIPPGGAGTGLSIASPLVYTWLSLPRYAQILGINPVHFQGSVGTSVWPLGNNACADIWPRHSWQSPDQVSREDLSFAIKESEDEISRFLGYPLAPTWYTNENHTYRQFHRPDMYATGGMNLRGMRKSVPAKWKKVIRAGRRALTSIGSATVAGGALAYTDEDGDGFFENATISMATSETEACEIRAYFTGMEGVREWEIRPAKSKEISGGTLTMMFDSWLFVDPDLQAVHPTLDNTTSAIDISDTTNFVSEVDIYREYTDNTAVSAQFFWEPVAGANVLTCSSCSGTGCYECTFTTQNGCLLVRDVEGGHVVPSPSTYDATSAQWATTAYTVCRDPDQVKIWYYAGDMDDAFLSGNKCDPLSDKFARVIAWLATARLERPFCQCGNVTALAKSWQEDLSAQGEIGHLFDFKLLGNPFGTRRGELMAYRAVSMLGDRKISVGVI
jgi:hypothetical protein